MIFVAKSWVWAGQAFFFQQHGCVLQAIMEFVFDDDEDLEAFFQQCPATELTCAEVDLLNALIRVAESVQAALPPSVSLQDWAQRRVPRGFERQVNCSGIVYVGGRSLMYGPVLRTQLYFRQLHSLYSSAAQPASVVEEFVFDDDESR